jgi:hypothetical protein
MSEKWGRYIRYLYCSKNRQPTKLTSFFWYGSERDNSIYNVYRCSGKAQEQHLGAAGLCTCCSEDVTPKKDQNRFLPSLDVFICHPQSSSHVVRGYINSVVQTASLYNLRVPAHNYYFGLFHSILYS